MSHAVRYALGLAGMLLVAGCGITQVQPNGPTAVPTTPPPTPVPTLSISGGSVAARVDGTSIAMNLFSAFTNYAYRSSLQSGAPVSPQEAAKQSLGQLIEDTVSLKEAMRLGVTPSAHDITQTFDAQIAQSGGGRAAFEKSLHAQGLTDASFRFLVRAHIAQQNISKKLFPEPVRGLIAGAKQILIGARKPLSAAEAFFTRTITPGVDRCTHKVLTYHRALIEARKLQRELAHGASFGSLAKKCSDDVYSSSTGGFLTGPSSTRILYPYAEGFAPNIEAAVFQKPVGRVQLLGSIDGWHLILVTSRGVVTYPKTVSRTLGAAIGTVIQQYHTQSWLNQQSQKAYAHTTIYERVS